MTRTTTVLTALVIAAGGFAAPAQATEGCVTKTEYRSVTKGYSKAKVTRIFDTSGKRLSYATSGGFTAEVRTYKTCQRFSSVSINYSNGHLAAKAAVWVS